MGRGTQVPSISLMFPEPPRFENQADQDSFDKWTSQVSQMFGSFIRDLNRKFQGLGVVMGSFTLANLPSPILYPNNLVLVSDETGGFVLAFSDGTNWRRVTDRAIVS